MTVITYSSAAGRLPKEIQVLEHPCDSGNVPVPLSEIVEPRSMLDPSENPIREPFGVKGQRWIEQGDERGAEGEKVKRRRQRLVRGFTRERMNRGRREKQCNLRNKCNKEVRKSGRECVEGRHKTRTDVSWTGEIKQREGGMGKRKRRPVFPRPFHLNNITEGEVKSGTITMEAMRRHHIFLWFTLLLFSLCPNPASSQVRVAFKSHL